MSYMLGEIEQQPKVIKDTILKNTEKVKKICNEIKKRNIDFILFVARGTSDNAATFGKYIFGYINGIPTGLAAPSLFTLYNRKLKLKNALVIGISQSGESSDVVEVINQTRKQGAYCIAITNKKKSSITEHSHATLYIYAGEEKSIPATKTYTAQLTLLYLLSFILADKTSELDKMNEVPKQIMKILLLQKYILNDIGNYKFINECIVLGRGLNYATALETALKIKETSYIKAEAMSGADFMHGPIAVIDKNFPVLLFAPQDATLNSMQDIAKNLEERHADRIIISSEDRILEYANFPIRMPKFEAIFTPLLYTVIGQIFAYYLAVIKGYNPDQPRYLKKITKTM